MKNNTGTNFDVRGGPEHQTESPKAQGETRLENTVRNEAKGLASASADAEPNEPDTNARNEAAEGFRSRNYRWVTALTNSSAANDSGPKSLTPLPQLQSASGPRRRLKRIELGLLPLKQEVVEANTTRDEKPSYPRQEIAKTTSSGDSPAKVNKHQFEAKDSGDDEDELDAQIDLELETLSASLVRMRRVAEEMGREIEIQNRTSARVLAKNDHDEMIQMETADIKNS